MRSDFIKSLQSDLHRRVINREKDERTTCQHTPKMIGL